MSAGEVAFLVLGLGLGAAIGATVVIVIRNASAAPGVTLTVTPDSVPRRRPTTLAEDAFPQHHRPATGGPADPVVVGRQHGRAARDLGLRSAGPRPQVGIPIRPEPDDVLTAIRERAPLRTVAAGTALRPDGISPVEPDRSSAAALFERRAAARRPVGEEVHSPLHTEAPSLSITGGPPPADPGQPAPVAGSRASRTGNDAPGAGTPAPAPTEDCSALRRVADERCSLAGRARAQALTTHEALREAQRGYDDHQARAERAGEASDPRAIRAAKEAAQQAFRAARASSAGPEIIEAAAREWLSEINRINRLARDAGVTATQEREAATAMVSVIERLTLEADAARISAEQADAACQAARRVAADCEAAARGKPRPVPPGGASAEPPTPPAEAGAGSRALLTDGAEPAILRMLRGDRPAQANVVAALAGTHPEDVRHWRLLLSTLVDEILARAIEAACLVYPADDAFWGAFTQPQNRDITTALASLGFRFDGLGSWVDDRTPSQRDLSLAVGYAGLDPMRVRHWPTDAEMAELFRDVSVAGDEYLVESAGDLTLGQLISLLGPRADQLAELWNDWARVRPVLLSD